MGKRRRSNQRVQIEDEKLEELRGDRRLWSSRDEMRYEKDGVLPSNSSLLRKAVDKYLERRRELKRT